MINTAVAALVLAGILRSREHPPVTGEFMLLGALTVPAALLAGVLTLWLSLHTL